MLDAGRGQEGWTTGLMLLSIVACAIAAMLGKTRLVFGDVTLLITEDSVQCWPSKGFIGLHSLPCLTVHGEVSRSLGSSPPSLDDEGMRAFRRHGPAVNTALLPDTSDR
jgi:hypothetical protein